MWIREVDFPEVLIGAHRAEKLVIFVGAGASRDAPSSLPDFRTLTADIAAEGQAEMTPDELEKPDVLLGRLDDQKVDVRLRVASRIGAQSSRPNRLHKAIVDLAATRPPIRLVTTNYDLHLSSVLEDVDIDVTEYIGPALPMGDDFSGLVYLHGSLRQEARHLVVTDRDFGRAYLRDAWATRFLERMFATFTVLFIGYSHGDVVMQYLARALGPGAPRYVLTSNPDAGNWRRLGIRPIGYEVVDGSHVALVDAVEGWASWMSMGLLEHRQRVAKLVSAPPSQVPEEASYLEMLVGDGEKVGLFAELARGKEWLQWASSRPEFRLLFDSTWRFHGYEFGPLVLVCRTFVMAEELTGAALKVVRDAGGRLGPLVWSAIGHQLHRADGARPEWLGTWVVLLIQSDPDNSEPWLDYALVSSRWPEHRATALLLFDYLTEPLATHEPSFGLGGDARFDVRLRGDNGWLRKAWKNLFLPNLAQAAPEVSAIVERHLRRAHQLLVATGSAGPGWDPVSFSRSAIDPHPQDGIRNSIDVLIDAGRDCLEALLDRGDELGTGYLSAWADSEVPMLRRLAVHGWVHREDVDATAKIVWLREREWLFNHQLRHEVFRLIESNLALADQSVADALVSDADVGPDDVVDENPRARERFNALAWMVRHAPGLQSAHDAFERVRLEHPEFVERAHLDLLSWTESGSVGSQPPMTVAELQSRIDDDPATAITELRRYEGATSPFDGPSWEDALGVLVEAVRDQPSDGFAVLDAAGGDHPDLVKAVIRGWAAATIDMDTAEGILARLAHVDLEAVADVVTRLLEGGGTGTNSIEWHRFSAARQLAADHWTALSGDPPASDVDDWLGRAINNPAGQLALFWVHAVAADWRDAGDSWAGLPEDLRAALEVIISGDDDRAAMAQVVFASQVRFFFGADRTWCEMHVLPLLDWVDPVRALRAWGGYLVWGRWDDQLLKSGLLEHYLATARHLDQFREEPRRQLAVHLASVAVNSDVDPTSWIPNFSATAEVSDREEWINQVGWTLRELPSEAVEYQWQRWMKQFWKDRLDSIPVQLSTEEASAMATWVLYLTDSVEEGVELALALPGTLVEHSRFLDDLDDDRLQRAPGAYANLLVHLLRNTQPPFWGCYYLERIVVRLRAEARVDVNSIVEQALRLGCGNAPHW